MKKRHPLLTPRRFHLGLLCWGLLLALGLAGCATSPAQPAGGSTTPAAEANADVTGEAEASAITDTVTDTAAATGTPSAGVSPLSSPLAQPTPTATAIPRFETDEGTGVVTGYLLLQTDAGVEPVTDVTVALASVLKDAEGKEAVVGYDRINAPRNVTDENGFFAITNVPPDRYGLIMDTVMTSYLLAQPDGSGDMLVTVEDQKQIDMGPLVYDMLPLPQPVE